MSKAFVNLRSFIEYLQKNNMLVSIDTEVSTDLEIAEIHRKVVEQGGKALFFKKVKGSEYPVVTNLFGTRERVELAFGTSAFTAIEEIVKLATTEMPPSFSKIWRAKKSLLRVATSRTKLNQKGAKNHGELDLKTGKGLECLPALKQWPDDGGHFLTLPLVYSEDPEINIPNLGMYRMQFYSETQAGMHWQIHRGGGFHYHKAEKLNKRLPVSVFLGGPPALTLATIAPLPENIPETVFCSFLMGGKLEYYKNASHPHPIFSEAEFVMQGYVEPHTRRDEGPFGDHFGYYSLAHPYPVFTATKVMARKDAIFPATIVGKPRQEDFYIGEYLERLFLPLLKLTMPGLEDLHTFGDSGFHAVAAIKVKNRYWKEAMAYAFRVLGEGQLSLQKYLLVTDTANSLTDFKDLLIHMLARTDWEKDLFVLSNISQDTLDYTGPQLNQGSKAIWLGLGEAKFSLCTQIPTSFPSGVRNAMLFCPGCLVVEMPKYTELKELARDFLSHSAFASFRMVVIVDSLAEVSSFPGAFLWILGTRTEPAADIFSTRSEIIRFHIKQAAPLFFDARMKPSYPGTVESCPEMEEKVKRRWNEYFPQISPF